MEGYLERFNSVYGFNKVINMADKEYTGRILINDGDQTVTVNIAGKSEDELYDIFSFMRKMKKQPGKYSINLEID
ncbi:MAG: hypothetical protein JSV56_11140 [Methanomassiliicoccales archaeon]|nr:MAG: hypothetical protein JSV56_11140 [Methanomassiliicoccales archaeon]